VELKDAETKKLLDYRESAFTHSCRDRLRRLNEVNETASITYEDLFEKKRYDLRSYVRAIFHGDFEHYGRLHSSGRRHAQGLPKEERSTIQISGEPVVELDYCAMHPHLLYAAEGIQYPDQGDPYNDAVNRMRGVRAGGPGAPTRSYVKHVLLALLDGDSIEKAEKSGNYWFHEHQEEHRSLRRLGIDRARPVIEALEKAHKPIAHYFGTAVGLRMMNKDARIALDVVTHFAEQDISIIPIHDSFLVQQRYGEELWQVMDQTYRKHNNGFTCPIKGPWSFNPRNRWKPKAHW
jgi:hypothetical protein